MSVNRKRKAEKVMATAMVKNGIEAIAERGRKKKAAELEHEATKYTTMVADYDDIAARGMPDYRDIDTGCNVYAYNEEEDEYIVLATDQRIVRGRWHHEVRSNEYSKRSIPVFHLGGKEYALDIPPANIEVI